MTVCNKNFTDSHYGACQCGVVWIRDMDHEKKWHKRRSFL